jgi:hypothetical protein
MPKPLTILSWQQRKGGLFKFSDIVGTVAVITEGDPSVESEKPSHDILG